MDRKTASVIIKELETLYPDAKTGLIFKNPFELLIATILSAQATDKQVNKITATLFKSYSTPQDFLSLTQKELAQLIKGCGLYKVKSRYLLQTCQLLVEKYRGEIPKKREELMDLPGVGRKTANVVLSVAFNEPAIAVDTHVARLAKRLGFSQGTKAELVEDDLMDLFPKSKWSLAHHLLINHGRQVCLARKPACSTCALCHLCPTGGKEKDLWN